MEEEHVKMQNNYNALYEYICDNPVYVVPVRVTMTNHTMTNHLLSLLLRSDNFWQEQDAFWKAIIMYRI